MAVGVVGAAQSASLWEKGFWLEGPRYDSNVPPCEVALDTIAARFVEKEARFWNSSLSITRFTNVREIAFRPWESGNIPRRFCTAVAEVNDGRKHRVNFYITEDGGEIGATWGVTWCVVGYDRNMAYSPACKMALP